jgi:hypothetical protein
LTATVACGGGAAASACGAYSPLWDPEVVVKDGGAPGSAQDAAAADSKLPDGTADTPASDAGVCPGAVLCSGKCVDLKTDPANCGGCGKACASGLLCSLGACSVSCTGGTLLCGKLCIDVANDPAHCGSCSSVCDTSKGQVCSQGACATKCAGGSTACAGKCVDTQTDPANCGACNAACDVAGGQWCYQGKCAVQCVGGTTACGGKCVDTQLDPANCGACAAKCSGAQLCSQGKCASSCTGGTKQCGTLCVDVANDPSNCGSCGTQCNAAAGEVCSNGTCATQCVGGTVLCSGKCADPSTDPANCGACGISCNSAAGQVCSQGKCLVQCGGGTALCGGKCVDLSNDPGNCGSCGAPCNSAGGEVCSAGTCSFSCVGGSSLCGAKCVDLSNDPGNCGSCGTVCNLALGEVCSQGKCGMQCSGGTSLCGGKCVDTQLDPANCGTCGKKCDTANGQVCSQGACALSCGGGTVLCNGKCIDTRFDPNNCGACGKKCNPNESCSSGGCQLTGTCPAAHPTLCNGTDCVDTQTDNAHCGACNNKCPLTAKCTGGKCVECDSATTDCDGDGWKVSDGDCCDKPGLCGADPALVNPGAIEVVGNGTDDNCNKKVDLFDQEDTLPCDGALAASSADPKDFAKAIGICRTAQESPPLAQKTWGLLAASLLRADGSALSYHDAHSLRAGFGAKITPLEGKAFAVLSTGKAADATQTNPGPNGGAPGGENVSTDQGGQAQSVRIDQGGQYSVRDWFVTANPPLKQANNLPNTQGCSSGGPGTQTNRANDSVMLVLRMRAPTNARAFSFNAYFFSAEFPEWVCTSFNDQFIALIDTPSGTPSPTPNPIDKNLMTYKDPQNTLWPIGINMAKGTNLFSVCNQADIANNQCLQNGSGPPGQPSPTSCGLGPADLAGTGFEKPTTRPCYVGGGTYWLTTAGNVVPGEIVEIRIAIWDVRDHIYDSLAVIDGLRWLPNATLPGTH